MGAKARGLHRLHLQCQADNHRAVALYHRLGFFVEGFHRHAVRVDGKWVDGYTMAKLLD
jgi:RimJ/RimL family protein N-acetyltransferase